MPDDVKKRAEAISPKPVLSSEAKAEEGFCRKGDCGGSALCLRTDSRKRHFVMGFARFSAFSSDSVTVDCSPGHGREIRQLRLEMAVPSRRAPISVYSPRPPADFVCLMVGPPHQLPHQRAGVFDNANLLCRRDLLGLPDSEKGARVYDAAGFFFPPRLFAERLTRDPLISLVAQGSCCRSTQPSQQG